MQRIREAQQGGGPVMAETFARHVGREHPDVSTYPSPFIRRQFDHCPYCGVEL